MKMALGGSTRPTKKVTRMSRSNAGGAVRGQARAAQVHSYNAAAKTTGSRTITGTRARNAAVSAGQVGRGARGFGSRSQPQPTNFGSGQLRMPSLNISLPHFDTHFNFDPMRSIGDTIRQSNPIDKLYDSVGKRLRGL